MLGKLWVQGQCWRDVEEVRGSLKCPQLSLCPLLGAVSRLTLRPSAFVLFIPSGAWPGRRAGMGLLGAYLAVT